MSELPRHKLTPTAIGERLVLERDEDQQEIERLEAENKQLRMTVGAALRLIAGALRTGEMPTDEVNHLLASVNTTLGEVGDE